LFPAVRMPHSGLSVIPGAEIVILSPSAALRAGSAKDLRLERLEFPRFARDDNHGVIA